MNFDTGWTSISQQRMADELGWRKYDVQRRLASLCGNGDGSRHSPTLDRAYLHAVTEPVSPGARRFRTFYALLNSEADGQDTDEADGRNATSSQPRPDPVPAASRRAGWSATDGQDDPSLTGRMVLPGTYGTSVKYVQRGDAAEQAAAPTSGGPPVGRSGHLRAGRNASNLGEAIYVLDELDPAWRERLHRVFSDALPAKWGLGEGIVTRDVDHVQVRHYEKPAGFYEWCEQTRRDTVRAGL